MIVIHWLVIFLDRDIPEVLLGFDGHNNQTTSSEYLED